MTHHNYPAPTCKCGGATQFEGIQRMKLLDYQYPLFTCQKCGTTMGGAREAYTEPSEGESLNPTDDLEAARRKGEREPQERIAQVGLKQENYEYLLNEAAALIDARDQRIDDLLKVIEEMEQIIAKREAESIKLRARLEDSESAVCAFINAVPDAMQSDPRLN